MAAPAGHWLGTRMGKHLIDSAAINIHELRGHKGAFDIQ